MASENGSTPTDVQQQVRELYERAERDAAQAAERIVGRTGFSQGLALLTENVVALTRVGNEGLDLALRNLRLAGRRDLTHLGEQLVRTENKLERVLQEVEALRDEVAGMRAEQAAGDGAASAPAGGRTRAAGRGTGTKRASGGSGAKRASGGAGAKRSGGSGAKRGSGSSTGRGSRAGARTTAAAGSAG